MSDKLSVSIIAGPAAPALLSASTVQRMGVLTSAPRDPAPTGLTIIRHNPDANPDTLIDQITSVADQRAVDHLVILCEPERPPMAYASLFVDHGPSNKGLLNAARLTKTAFAINCRAFLDAILSRTTSSAATCFMAEQMEFVDQIFFERASGENEFDLARSIARILNPRAEVSPLPEAWRDSPADSFNFDAALKGAGWQRLLDGAQLTQEPDSQMTAMHYSARRPFHPERFWNFLQHKSDRVFRAKGFFWLASRMDEVGGLNLAGSELHCASAGAWWATRESEMPPRARGQWQEPFGDRRQTFAVMARDLDRATLQSELDACLLTDDEMTGGLEKWHDFADPFPSWSAHHTHTHSHQHEHDGDCDHHHHDSDEHHCCHH
jgi:G3E family GTPase